MSRLAIAICVAIVAVPSAAAAQFIGRSVPRAGTFEISGGFLWSGGYDFDTALANETRNPPTGTTPLTLFQAEPRLDSAIGAEAHLGFYFSPRLSIEGGLQFSRPSLLVQSTGDFEQATDTAGSSPFSQYVIDGSILYQFGTGRLTPFVSGGAGYLRQVLEEGSVVETGNEFHGGGGVKYRLSSARRFGIRGEVRLSSQSGGISLDGTSKRRFVPTFSGGLAYLF